MTSLKLKATTHPQVGYPDSLTHCDDVFSLQEAPLLVFVHHAMISSSGVLLSIVLHARLLGSAGNKLLIS